MSGFQDTECASGKKVYLTFTHANHDARALRRSGKRNDARAFLCRVCHKFHTGGNV